MSTTDRKELLNELYDALLITGGAVAISMTSKILREPSGTPESVKGTVKLALAVGISTVGIKYVQSKGYLPVDPFSKPK